MTMKSNTFKKIFVELKILNYETDILLFKFGFSINSPEVKLMQKQNIQNPGSLFVLSAYHLTMFGFAYILFGK